MLCRTMNSSQLQQGEVRKLAAHSQARREVEVIKNGNI